MLVSSLFSFFVRVNANKRNLDEANKNNDFALFRVGCVHCMILGRGRIQRNVGQTTLTKILARRTIKK